jgi:O-antigen/teichoic acid export membrane protein
MENIPKQILKNTTALAIAQVAGLFSSFVLTYFLARNLGVTGLGIYSTVMSYYGLAAHFCAAGVQGLLVREIARDLSQTNRYMVHAGLITAVASLVGTLFFGLLVSQLGYAPETRTGVFVANLTLIPATWTVIYETVFIAHQKAEYILYTVLLTLLGRIGTSIYLLLNGYGVVSLLVAMLIFQCISFVLRTYFLVRHIVVPRWEFDLSFALQMLKDLRTFTAIGSLTSVFANLEVLLLSFLQTEATVGIYSAASKLVAMWVVIPWSYMRAVFPLLAQAHVSSHQDFQRLVERSVKYLLAFALPLAVGTVVIADRIIYLFYGPGFEASIPVLRWLALLLIPVFVNEVLWRILTARDEQHLALRTQIVALTTKAGVSFIAVPFISYTGTILAQIFTLVVQVAMHIFYVQRGGRPIPFIRLAWRFGLAAVLMGGFSWLLARWFNLFIVVPLAVAFYGLLIALLRAFSPDDLALFSNLVRRREVSSSLPSQS